MRRWARARAVPGFSATVRHCAPSRERPRASRTARSCAVVCSRLTTLSVRPALIRVTLDASDWRPTFMSPLGRLEAVRN
eukprot:3561415-Prymnesium_polylepis.1